MRTRIALTALLAAIVVFAGSPAMPARAAETKYDFEKCEQGWKAKAGWERSDLTEGSTNSGQVMAYNLYDDGLERGEAVTSAVHQWPGGKKKVTFKARWQFEYYPPEPSGQLTTLDRGAFETSTDGGKTWKSRSGFGLTNSSFPEFNAVVAEFDAPAGAIQFRFVIYSDGNTPGFGLQVDDIAIPTASPDGIGCK